jgi:hypothetical protein
MFSFGLLLFFTSQLLHELLETNAGAGGKISAEGNRMRFTAQFSTDLD